MSIINEQPDDRELAKADDHTEYELEKKFEIDNPPGNNGLCGMCGWKPAWLQKYATANFFVVNFCVVAILQGALFTYMVSIMSTLEKRYAFDSKVSGIILISDNFSNMILSPIFGYLGSKYNRSRLIAMGELVVALSCLIGAVPYFVYGPGLHLHKSSVGNLSATLSDNQTDFDLCITRDSLETCSVSEASVDANWLVRNLSLPVIILWLSNFANGVGYTAFFTIGLTYVDDNIKKSSSAIYFSTMSTVRLLGPMFGYLLSSVCLKFNENPFIDPGFNNLDPRWIGAWWIGFLILGTSILIFTLPMFFYPRTLGNVKQSPGNDFHFTKLKDAWDSLKRLAGNMMLVCHTCSGVFRVIGLFGYYINKPKYIELQFRQSASSASFFTGATSVVTMAVGTMAGGFLIKKYRPSAQKLAILIVSVEMFAASSLFVASFLKCPPPHFEGLELINQPSTVMSSCSGGCDCSPKVYQPVCSADGFTNYFSPCYAGCQSYASKPGSSKFIFSNCSCSVNSTPSSLPSARISSLSEGQAESGLCGTACNMFVYFVSLHAFSNSIGALTRTADMLLMLRCVEPRDKNFSFGVTGFIFSLFAFIPFPLIFGAIVDSTCLVWEKTCGRSGNCWLYDIEKLRTHLHYGSLCFLVIGLFFEVGTVLYAKRLKNFYDDEDEEIEMKAGTKAIEGVEVLDAKLPTQPTSKISS